MTYKKIISIPDQHIVANQNLRRFEALGNLIVHHNPDYVINGGDMFEANGLYGVTAKKSWNPKEELCKEVEEDLEQGYRAFSLMWAPFDKANDKLKKSKKKTTRRPNSIFCLGNHDARIEHFVRVNFKFFQDRWGVDDPLKNVYNQEEHWDHIFPFQYPVEVEGILFSHNYSSGTATASTMDTILKLASQSAVGYHSHKGEFSAGYTATGRPAFVMQSGWFADPDETTPDWVGPQGGRNWWNGITILHGVDGRGTFEPEFMSTERLIREYY